MKKHGIHRIAGGGALFSLSIAISLSLISCKGRTADNMVPSGDTVEVIFNDPDDSTDNTFSDSINQDSLKNEN